MLALILKGEGGAISCLNSLYYSLFLFPYYQEESYSGFTPHQARTDCSIQDADRGAVPHGSVRFSDRSNVELQVIGRDPLMSEFNTHLLEENTIRQ